MDEPRAGDIADRVIRIFLDGLEKAGADPRKLNMDAMRARLLADVTPDELETLRNTGD